jgi:hypothetical protein
VGHLGPAPGELPQRSRQVHQVHQPRNLLGALRNRPPQNHLPHFQSEEATLDSGRVSCSGAAMPTLDSRGAARTLAPPRVLLCKGWRREGGRAAGGAGGRPQLRRAGVKSRCSRPRAAARECSAGGLGAACGRGAGAGGASWAGGVDEGWKP